MRIRALALAVAALGALAGAVPATAGHDADDDHSRNVDMLARRPIERAEGVRASGSDLAFQGRLLVAGTYEGTSLWRITRNAPYVRQISFHDCPGSQGDVSIWGDLAFVSIDSPSSNNVESAVCNDTNDSAGKEGVRIVDVSEPARPHQVGFVETDCGSHTHTLVPDGDDLYVYVQSYPLGAPTATCNVASHRKISVIKVNRDQPARSRVVSTPDVSPAIGCHDVTVYPRKDLAAAACISESQVWDISNRRRPEILAHIVNPAIQIHHSSAFTWDGKYVIVSDEYAGAAGGGGCVGEEDAPVGAMWFYRIDDPSNPERVGHHSLPRVPPADSPEEAARLRCTTHNYNVLPTKDRDRYVVASSYYAGGLSIVKFGDPAAATEIGHYLPQDDGVLPDMWSAYWYNGRIYTNEHASKAGVGVFEMRGTGRDDVRYFERRLNPQTQIPSFK